MPPTSLEGSGTRPTPFQYSFIVFISSLDPSLPTVTSDAGLFLFKNRLYCPTQDASVSSSLKDAPGSRLTCKQREMKRSEPKKGHPNLSKGVIRHFLWSQVRPTTLTLRESAKCNFMASKRQFFLLNSTTYLIVSHKQISLNCFVLHLLPSIPFVISCSLETPCSSIFGH